MRSSVRVVVAPVAVVLAAACIWVSESLEASGEVDLAERIKSGYGVNDAFPTDFGVYLSPEAESSLAVQASGTLAGALRPQPLSTWNLRIPTGPDSAYFWFGPADEVSLYEGVQSLSNRSGLWNGSSDQPLLVHFIIPTGSLAAQTCAVWSEPSGAQHEVKATVAAVTSSDLVTCDIPALGEYRHLAIGLALNWDRRTQDSGIVQTVSTGIRNESSPLVNSPDDLDKLGFAQQIQVDVFLEEGAQVQSVLPAPDASNPIQARWRVEAGDSVFLVEEDRFSRGLADGVRQLLLIGAGALFALAIDSAFRFPLRERSAMRDERH